MVLYSFACNTVAHVEAHILIHLCQVHRWIRSSPMGQWHLSSVASRNEEATWPGLGSGSQTPVCSSTPPWWVECCEGRSWEHSPSGHHEPAKIITRLNTLNWNITVQHKWKLLWSYIKMNKFKDKTLKGKLCYECTWKKTTICGQSPNCTKLDNMWYMICDLYCP